MRNFWMMVLVGAMLLAAPSVGMARAQNAMVARQQEKVAETDRRKQIADETAKLLVLATELKAAVDKSNKNEMSLEVIRKADGVEKLAHDLKLKMQG